MKLIAGIAAVMVAVGAAEAAETEVPLSFADAGGGGAAIGKVRVVETRYGLVFHPDLTSLPPGLHGFHLHENPSCAPGPQNGASAPAMAAGGHWDPESAKKHGEPWGDGHRGDLPPLYVAADGSAKTPVLAPRLTKLADISGRALMVHAGGDNHSDHPATLGGGGGRIACGVVGG